MRVFVRTVIVLFFAALLGACGGDGSDREDAAPERESRLEAEQDVQSALRSAATAQESYFTSNLAYTTSLSDLEAEGLTTDENVSLTIARANDAGYCMVAEHASLDLTYHYDSDAGTAGEGPC